MPAQVIFAYANDNKQSLKFIEEEIDAVYDSINNINTVRNGLVNPVKLEHVSLLELINEFNARKDELTVFHFSGHSGQFDLLLDSDELIDGRAIAKLMEPATNIELVFLNGCANKKLIDWFHEAGVKRVIATRRKVFDQYASEFSKIFYKVLATGTIGEAFDQAKAYIIATKIENIHQQSRHISSDNLKGGEEEFPYSLYYRPIFKKTMARNDDLNKYGEWDKWSFSDYRFTATEYKPCLKLLNTIGAQGLEMVKYLHRTGSTDKAEINAFADLHNEYKKFKASPDINFSGKLSDKIAQLLPRPLGIIMQQLVGTAKEIMRGKTQQYDALLNYQFRFYDLLLKISCYTMVSDMYEVIRR